MCIERDELVEWFEDEDNAGVAGNAELADLLDEDEQVVRREGRLRGVRRVGSTMVWTMDDALALLDDLTAEDEAEDDGEDDE
ncbi:MAG: hypothetical protein JW751_13230 [Polyangiaceae bacterium]|nr:hypothetical protein [Polyangiaceae bacterium]HOU89830.1 hypothetical protein [Polyangiaceae bacterium]